MQMWQEFLAFRSNSTATQVWVAPLSPSVCKAEALVITVRQTGRKKKVWSVCGGIQLPIFLARDEVHKLSPFHYESSPTAQHELPLNIFFCLFGNITNVLRLWNKCAAGSVALGRPRPCAASLACLEIYHSSSLASGRAKGHTLLDACLRSSSMVLQRQSWTYVIWKVTSSMRRITSLTDPVFNNYPDHFMAMMSHLLLL